MKSANADSETTTEINDNLKLIMKPNWLRQMEEDLSENRELGIGDLLDALGRAIAEVGYDEVYADLLTGEPLEGCDAPGKTDFGPAGLGRGRCPRLAEKGIYPLGPRYSPGGNGHLNIIPGDQKVACTPLALTLVNSHDRLHRFRVDWDHEDDRAVLAIPLASFGHVENRKQGNAAMPSGTAVASLRLAATHSRLPACRAQPHSP